MVGSPVGRIVARWAGPSPVYAELARVLKASARRNSPAWEVDVRRSHGRELTRYEAFVEKVTSWAMALGSAPDGMLVAFLDADTIVTGPLDEIAALDFDIAVTTRALAKAPINSGVVFARASDEVRGFFDRWLESTERLFELDGGRFSDQDALHKLVAQTDLNVVRVPCVRWNCEQTSWARFGPKTRIVHIKSDARKRIFHGLKRCSSPGGERVVKLWRAYQEAAS